MLLLLLIALCIGNTYGQPDPPPYQRVQLAVGGNTQIVTWSGCNTLACGIEHQDKCERKIFVQTAFQVRNSSQVVSLYVIFGSVCHPVNYYPDMSRLRVNSVQNYWDSRRNVPTGCVFIQNEEAEPVILDYYLQTICQGSSITPNLVLGLFLMMFNIVR